MKGPVRLTTYVSLTCTNCPDVVQALQRHDHAERTDSAPDCGRSHQPGGSRGTENTGVPSVFADGKLIHVGRGDFGELLAKLEEQYGTETNSAETSIKKYDVIVAGGGPAGSAAILFGP